MKNEECPYCKSTMKSIRESGFVGCEHCYQSISSLIHASRSLFDGKSFSGKPPKRRDDGQI